MLGISHDALKRVCGYMDQVFMVACLEINIGLHEQIGIHHHFLPVDLNRRKTVHACERWNFERPGENDCVRSAAGSGEDDARPATCSPTRCTPSRI